jgi:EmrB/QacA subfamily drug resistance transporter
MMAAPPGSRRRRWSAFAFLLLGLLIVVMDQTITAVVLPDIVTDLGADVSAASLTVTVFTVAAAATFVLLGRVADAIGRRRMAVLALVGFAVGSLITGMADSLPALLVGRAMQGLVLAAFAPATVGLLNATFPKGHDRVVAFSLWATATGSGVAIGPLLGGALAQAASWRAPFFLNIPIALIAAIGLHLLMQESRASEGRLRVDLPGTLLLALGMAGVVFGLQEGPSQGWWLAVSGSGLSPVAVLLPVGIAATIGFVLVERHRNKADLPVLVDVRLLRLRTFRDGVLSSAGMSMALYGVVLVIPIFTQFVLGADPMTSGAVLMAMGIGMMAGGIGGASLIRKLGHHRAALVGLSLQPVLLLALLPLVQVPESPWVLTPVLLLYGLSYGVAFSALTNIMFGDVPDDLTSLSGGVSSTIRLGAGALASALMVGIITGMSTGGVERDLAQYPDLNASQKQALEQMAHFSTGPGMDSSGSRNDVLAQLEADPQFSDLVTEVRGTFVTATRSALLLAALMALLGAVIAWRMPRTNQKEFTASRPDDALSGRGDS